MKVGDKCADVDHMQRLLVGALFAESRAPRRLPAVRVTARHAASPPFSPRGHVTRVPVSARLRASCTIRRPRPKELDSHR